MSVIRGGLRSVNDANAVLRDIECDPDVYVGAAVRLSGGIAFNGFADSELHSNIIGIVEEKTSATSCNIRLFGYTLDIFTGLDESKVYFLSDTVPGEITTVVPSASGHIRLQIGKPFSTNSLVVLIGERVKRA